MLDWKLDIQGAIDLPNFGSRNGPTLIELGSRYAALAPELERRGHQVEALVLESGCTASSACPAAGAAAPTRDGTAPSEGNSGNFYSARGIAGCGILASWPRSFWLASSIHGMPLSVGPI